MFHRNNCHILLIQGVRTNLYHDKGVSRVLRRFWKINFYYDRELIQAYNKNFKNILTVLIFKYKSWWFLCYKRSLIDLTSARICQVCKPCWSQEMKKKLVPFIICEVEKQKFPVSNKKLYNFFLFFLVFSCFFLFFCFCFCFFFEDIALSSFWAIC